MATAEPARQQMEERSTPIAGLPSYSTARMQNPAKPRRGLSHVETDGGANSKQNPDQRHRHSLPTRSRVHINPAPFAILVERQARTSWQYEKAGCLRTVSGFRKGVAMMAPVAQASTSGRGLAQPAPALYSGAHLHPSRRLSQRTLADCAHSDRPCRYLRCDVHKGLCAVNDILQSSPKLTPTRDRCSDIFRWQPPMHREGAAAQEGTGERLACTLSVLPIAPKPSLPLAGVNAPLSLCHGPVTQGCPMRLY